MIQMILFLFIAPHEASAKTLSMVSYDSPLGLNGSIISSRCETEGDQIVLKFTSINSNANCSITFTDEYLQDGQNYCRLINEDKFNSVFCKQTPGVLEIADIDVIYAGTKQAYPYPQNDNGNLKFGPLLQFHHKPPDGVTLPSLKEMEYYNKYFHTDKVDNLSGAMAYCHKQEKHLPTIRELTYFAQS